MFVPVQAEVKQFKVVFDRFDDNNNGEVSASRESELEFD